ncbi:alpha-N-acetylgalactosaminidase-like [Oppia nitens]|uniref:alpha-N-acetylgalactosaminidase-like n=1 Tax=Oppia nitens TaxID=1686743 RepID=UPI0023D9FFBE|nr:alpha-N-acetylgalactosaminidase-like [Oppia nitens]
MHLVDIIYNPVIVYTVHSRNDGLALTPPMGWLSWVRFACETDCKKYPNSCINEELYKEQADRLVKDGFKELGYVYVNIDDCWSEKERDVHQRLVPDKHRFPSGMKALADYMHSQGLKLGIYGDVGPQTCAHYPGQNDKNGSNYFSIDAKTFAEWGIDSFKFDGCNEDPKHFDDLYPKMGKALNESGQPMVFICEWPLYQLHHKITPNYSAIENTCHVYRNHGDVSDGWNSIISIINFYGDNNDLFIKYNGPGHFNDPDMLIIGGFGLSYEQSRTQMAMWAMFSAPLYMSNDLRALKPELRQILQNKALIALNQDKHAIMAKRVYTDKNTQIWVKQVEPKVNNQWSYAIVYLSTKSIGDRYYISHKVSQLITDTKNTTEYVVHDLFLDEGKEILGTLRVSDNLELKVAIAGACRLVKLVPKY